MRRLNSLLVTMAIAVPATAQACGLHGDFSGMTFSNLSLISAQHTGNYTMMSPPSSQGVRHIEFSTGDSFDDLSDKDAGTANAPASDFNPEDPVTSQ